MYVASRGLYSLKPPTIFVPPCIKEDVEKLLDIHRTMGQVELNVDLVPLDVGMYLCFSYFVCGLIYLQAGNDSSCFAFR